MDPEDHNKPYIVKDSEHRDVCDICWKRDGKQGLHLLRCKDCKLLVHAECYSYIPLAKDSTKEFTCWACASVGSVVKVRQRDQTTDKRKEFAVKERPSECCLCAVDDGSAVPHAMHPLFDDHGPRGRQILLPASPGSALGQARTETRPVVLPERLAWVHTLCASALATRGFCYGVMKDGDYGEDEDPDRITEDHDSVNSELEINGSEEYEVESTHHFVIMSQKWYGRNAVVREIRERREGLKCTFCGLKDSAQDCQRIALQCYANDNLEFEGFKHTHSKSLEKDDCHQALHVGCAFYGHDDDGNYFPNRRVFFFPGSENSEHTEPVVNIFCHNHANDIVKADLKSGLKLYYPVTPAKPTGNQVSSRRGASLQSSPQKRHPNQIIARPQVPLRGRVAHQLGISRRAPNTQNVRIRKGQKMAVSRSSTNSRPGGRERNDASSHSMERLSKTQGLRDNSKKPFGIAKDKSPAENHHQLKRSRMEEATTQSCSSKTLRLADGSNTEDLNVTEDKNNEQLTSRIEESPPTISSMGPILKEQPNKCIDITNSANTEDNCSKSNRSETKKAGVEILLNDPDLKLPSKTEGSREDPIKLDIIKEETNEESCSRLAGSRMEEASSKLLSKDPCTERSSEREESTNSMDHVTDEVAGESGSQSEIGVSVIYREMVDDLVKQLKCETSLTSKTNKTHLCYDYWKKLTENSIPSEKFETMWVEARADAVKTIDSPSHDVNAPSRYENLNKVECTDAVLKEFLTGLDSTQSAHVKSMAMSLCNAVRLLEKPDQSSLYICMLTTKTELEKQFSRMTIDLFGLLWNRAKAAVEKICNRVFNDEKASRFLSTEKYLTADDFHLSADSSTKFSDKDKDSDAQLAKQQCTTSSNEVAEVQSVGTEQSNKDQIKEQSISTKQGGSIKKEARRAVKNISQIVKSERHLPLQLLLTKQKHLFRDKLAGWSNSKFERFWDVVTDEVEQEWGRQVGTEPIDWSFLVVGESFDADRLNEYISGVDLEKL